MEKPTVIDITGNGWCFCTIHNEYFDVDEGWCSGCRQDDFELLADEIMYGVNDEDCFLA